MGDVILVRDGFGELPDDWCCRGECCGPGSWCCQRAGLHYHDDIEPPQWVGHPPRLDDTTTTTTSERCNP